MRCGDDASARRNSRNAAKGSNVGSQCCWKQAHRTSLWLPAVMAERCDSDGKSCTVVTEMWKSRVLSTEHRLVRQGAIKGRHRPSNSSTSCNRCLSSTEYTNIHRRYVATVQAAATHVEPIGAALTLNHWLAIINTVAHTACAFARDATAVRGWGGQAIGIG
jgi:hypothetical protein